MENLQLIKGYQNRINNDRVTITGSQPPTGLKIVLIGRKGVGKSATGNTILMRKVFLSRLSSTAVTQKCQMEQGEPDGHILAVVDTPALFGRSRSDEVMEEIQRCLSQASPGPVVLLVVVQAGTFTRDERKTVKIIQSAFGKETAHYTMALFTRGDDLRAEGRSVEDLIGADPAVRDFIRECSGGYHVVDNRDSGPSEVVELLQKINNLVQRNGERGSTSEGWSRAAAGGCAVIGGLSVVLALIMVLKQA